MTVASLAELTALRLVAHLVVQMVLHSVDHSAARRADHSACWTVGSKAMKKAVHSVVLLVDSME